MPTVRIAIGADHAGFLLKEHFKQTLVKLGHTVDDHGTHLQVVEVTAEPGDVILCHPFLYHAAAQNLTGTPRFMCNRTTPLREPMELNRADGHYSPVEESIRRALRSGVAA